MTRAVTTLARTEFLFRLFAVGHVIAWDAEGEDRLNHPRLAGVHCNSVRCDRLIGQSFRSIARGRHRGGLGLPKGFIRAVKTPVASLFLLRIFFVVSVLMAEWANGAYISRMRRIAPALLRAILSVAGVVFGLVLVGYFAWLAWHLVRWILQTCKNSAASTTLRARLVEWTLQKELVSR